MATFVDRSYDLLNQRSLRVISFFADLDFTLANIGAPYTAHLDIFWDGSQVRLISTSQPVSGLSRFDRLKYYNQGLGLMKLAMNNILYS